VVFWLLWKSLSVFADQLVVSHVDGSSRGCGGDSDMLGDVSRSCKLQPISVRDGPWQVRSWFLIKVSLKEANRGKPKSKKEWMEDAALKWLILWEVLQSCHYKLGRRCWTKWCSSFEESKPFEWCGRLGCACCCWAVLVRIWGSLSFVIHSVIESKT